MACGCEGGRGQLHSFNKRHTHKSGPDQVPPAGQFKQQQSNDGSCGPCHRVSEELQLEKQLVWFTYYIFYFFCVCVQLGLIFVFCNDCFVFNRQIIFVQLSLICVLLFVFVFWLCVFAQLILFSMSRLFLFSFFVQLSLVCVLLVFLVQLIFVYSEQVFLLSLVFGLFFGCLILVDICFGYFCLVKLVFFLCRFLL